MSRSSAAWLSARPILGAKYTLLLDRPMLLDILGKHKVPYTAFKYAENTGQMAPIREQAGTFADSIKLWSAG